MFFPAYRILQKNNVFFLNVLIDTNFYSWVIYRYYTEIISNEFQEIILMPITFISLYYEFYFTT